MHDKYEEQKIENTNKNAIKVVALLEFFSTHLLQSFVLFTHFICLSSKCSSFYHANNTYLAHRNNKKIHRTLSEGNALNTVAKIKLKLLACDDSLVTQENFRWPRSLQPQPAHAQNRYILIVCPFIVYQIKINVLLRSCALVFSFSLPHYWVFGV